jgi:hypothetical protein
LIIFSVIAESCKQIKRSEFIDRKNSDLSICGCEVIDVDEIGIETEEY